jgi:hypothetical protein
MRFSWPVALLCGLCVEAALFLVNITRQHLAAIAARFDSGQLRTCVDAVLPSRKPGKLI